MSEIGQKLIQTVRDIADANPDFTYVKPPGLAQCVYMHEGKPSCILGHAFFLHGLIDGDFKYNSVWAGSLLYEMNLGLDWGEVNWLTRVQDRQDAGGNWGESVQYADAVDEACATLN